MARRQRRKIILYRRNRAFEKRRQKRSRVRNRHRRNWRRKSARRRTWWQISEGRMQCRQRRPIRSHLQRGARIRC